jgi:hypothetical protein
MPTTKAKPLKQRDYESKTIVLRPSQCRALEKLAAQEERSLSYLIRSAVDTLLSASN